MSLATDPLVYLRRTLDSGTHNDVSQMIRDRDSVIARYQPILLHPFDMADADFFGFLKFENNRHWWGIGREADRLMHRMAAVRSMIAGLIDETAPIAVRIDEMGDLPGFSPDVFTAVLLVCFPDTFGVWNSISESAMRRLGLWPDVDASASRGTVYAAVNEMLKLCAAEVGTDLWTLDALWWAAEKEHDPTKHFVRAGRSARPTPRTSGAGVAAPKARAPKPVAPTEDTFVCKLCFTTKLRRLESATPNVCVDCD